MSSGSTAAHAPGPAGAVLVPASQIASRRGSVIWMSSNTRLRHTSETLGLENLQPLGTQNLGGFQRVLAPFRRAVRVERIPTKSALAQEAISMTAQSGTPQSPHCLSPGLTSVENTGILPPTRVCDQP